MSKPIWWPKCPYALSELGMTYADYIAVVIPEPKLRMMIRECLLREGWELAEDEIWKCLKEGTSIYEKLKDVLLSKE